jgi:thiol:disulfide interchange protein DsbD
MDRPFPHPRPFRPRRLLPLAALILLGLGVNAQASILSRLLAHEPHRFLPATRAFRFHATRLNRETLRLVWHLAPGYYLYRRQFRFRVVVPARARLGAPRFPRATLRNDGTFGIVHVFFNRLALPLPVYGTQGQALTLKVRYQGCSVAGLCYPPIHRTLFLPASQVRPAPTADRITQPSLAGSLGNLRHEAGRLTLHAPLGLAILAFVLMGVLLTFTPCSAPMIPIIVTVLGRGGSKRLRSLLPRALAYVFALALSYTVAGLIAGAIGRSLSTILETPWVIGTLAALFVVLALSMFGLFELRLPGTFQNWVSRHESRPGQVGGMAGSAAMGVVSAILVGPCLVPPLAAILVLIAQHGAILRGGILLFALGIGMGIPLLVFGLSAGRLWPKSGPWLRAVNTLLGLLLLALALWYLSDILPMRWIIALSGLLLLLCGGFLSQAERASRERGPGLTPWLWALCVLFTLLGAMELVGASLGQASLLNPLAALSAPAGRSAFSAPAASPIDWTRVTNLAQFDRALAQVHRNRRAAVVDFWAHWCISCRLMDRRLAHDRAIGLLVRRLAFIRVDLTRDTQDSRFLLHHFQILGPPTFLFYSPAGLLVPHDRLIGESGMTRFLRHVRVALAWPPTGT